LHRERGGDRRPLCAWVLLNCLILVANSGSRHRIFQQPIWEPKTLCWSNFSAFPGFDGHIVSTLLCTSLDRREARRIYHGWNSGCAATQGT
jgi:hypothetical protein